MLGGRTVGGDKIVDTGDGFHALASQYDGHANLAVEGCVAFAEVGRDHAGAVLCIFTLYGIHLDDGAEVVPTGGVGIGLTGAVGYVELGYLHVIAAEHHR